MATPDTLTHKRIIVMGLGRFGGGVGVTRWLARQGAKVTVTDLAPADELTESLAQLEGLANVAYRLGGHDEADLDSCDLLVVNPAVPDDAPFLLAAKARGVATTTEINLFLRRCPAAIVGITGSVGKSTTAAMTELVLACEYTTHLGGNIGRSLLEEMADGRIGPEDVVVLELSSFQLQHTPQTRISPHVALVTNLQPNHLDRHGTMEAYAAAKRNIFRFQGGDDLLLLPAGDSAVAAWADEAPGRVEMFGAKGDAEPLDLLVPGEHNQQNARAALAIGRAMGVDRDVAAAALGTFRGLPHRLALVGEIEGVRYYDDSKATTPAGAMVALGSFPVGRVVAIVGGYDKKLPLEALCDLLAARCKAVIATGQIAGQIAELMESRVTAEGPAVVTAAPFDDAVAAAIDHADRGDVVLLSPACASWDQFTNYIQRGMRFQQLISARR